MITVFTGPVMVGKSWQLIRRIIYCESQKSCYTFSPARGEFIHTRVANIEPIRAVRIDRENVFQAIENIYEDLRNGYSVFIDEFQFIDFMLPPDEIKEIVSKFDLLVTLHSGTMHIAGIDLSFKCEPFYSMANLMAYADDVIKFRGTYEEVRYSLLKEPSETENTNQPFAEYIPVSRQQFREILK